MVTIVDCHPDIRYRLSPFALTSADRVYRLNHNFGAYNRYIPLGAYQSEYTYFADDDMVPGRRCIEHFLDVCPSMFGVLGQNGRRLNRDGTYSRRGVERTSELEIVDFLIRGYFVQTRYLEAINRFRWKLGLQGAAAVEDDMLLSFAMQVEYGLYSYLSPHDSDPETKQNVLNLRSPHALVRRPDHFDRRIDLLTMAQKAGWCSVHGKGWTGTNLDRVGKQRISS